MSNRSSTSEMTPRSIPANIEAEKAVLGSILMDPDAFLKIGATLQPADFFRDSHGVLFETLQSMSHNRDAIDSITLIDALERSDKLDFIGGPSYLTSLAVSVPNALYVEHYAKIVADAAARRRLISAAGQVAELAYDENGEVDEAIDRAEQVVLAVGENRITKDLQPMRPIVTSLVEHIDFLSRNQDQLMGIPSGFTMLDNMLGGFQKSDLIILAARPGMGKTSMVLSIAQHAAKQHDARIAFFSLEMSNEQLTNRLLAMETGIDSHRLRMGTVHDEEWPIVLEAANILADTKVFIDDTPAATVSDIRTKSRRLHAEHGLDMVIVDYMQLMNGQGRNENRQQEISLISRSLKALARELNVPVIACSQLSRAVENRADKRPMLSDLRESGSIEQDSDAVLFIYREDYYVEDSDRQNIADILIAKHRHGATGTVSLYFRKELTQFRDLELSRTDLN